MVRDGLTPAAAAWDGLLRPDVELSAEFCRQFSETLRRRRLTFGDRVHCPFLRPFFLTRDEETRVRQVAEAVAGLAERVAQRAVSDPFLLEQFGLTADEARLVRIDPRYPTVSTSSRLDALSAVRRAFGPDDRNASFFTDAERTMIRRHIPWTRIVADTATTHDSESIELLEHVRRYREELVLKPNDEYGGKGVSLGWELSQAEWERALEGALADRPMAWIVQRRIPVRREVFPQFQPGTGAAFGEMLVDFAPYLFDGRLAGYLTRLSATGLANVTSGGGQVPVFVVEPRS